MRMDLNQKWKAIVIIILQWVCLIHGQVTTLSALDSELSTLADAYYDLQTLIPVQTLTDTMSVALDMNIASVVEFDDNYGHATISGYLTVTWTEQRLTASRTSNDVSAMIKASTMWTPPLTLINAVSSDAEIRATTDNVNYNFKTGTSVWKPWVSLTVKCDSGMKFFPFDEQKCAFKFASGDYTSSEVLLSATNSYIKMDSFEESSLWEIESSSASAYVLNSVSYVEYNMKMTRRPQFYFSVIVVPIITIGLLHIFVFMIPVSTQQRATFSIMNVLACVILLSLATTLIPEAALPMSLIVHYIFGELFMNALITAVVIILEKMNFGVDDNGVWTFFSGKSNRRQSHPRANAHKEKVSVQPISETNGSHSVRSGNDVHVTTISPISAWDDDDSVIPIGRQSTQEDGETESKQHLSPIIDIICFIVFLFIHICVSVSFLVPLALNSD